MNRPIAFAVILGVLGVLCAAIAVHGQSTPAQPEGVGGADALVEKMRKAALSMQRKSWEQGVLAQAFLELGDDEMVMMMSRDSLIHLSKDRLVAAMGGAPVDPLMGGEAG